MSRPAPNVDLRAPPDSELLVRMRDKRVPDHRMTSVSRMNVSLRNVRK